MGFAGKKVLQNRKCEGRCAGIIDSWFNCAFFQKMKTKRREALCRATTAGTVRRAEVLIVIKKTDLNLSFYNLTASCRPT